MSNKSTKFQEIQLTKVELNFLENLKTRIRDCARDFDGLSEETQSFYGIVRGAVNSMYNVCLHSGENLTDKESYYLNFLLEQIQILEFDIALNLKEPKEYSAIDKN